MNEPDDVVSEALVAGRLALKAAEELVGRLEQGPGDVTPAMHFASCLEIARSLRHAAQDAAALTLGSAIENGCSADLLDIPSADPVD